MQYHMQARMLPECVVSCLVDSVCTVQVSTGGMNRNGYFGIAPKNITLNNQVAPQQTPPPKNACFSFSLQFLVEMESKLMRSAVSVATKMCKRSRYNFTMENTIRHPRGWSFV